MEPLVVKEIEGPIPIIDHGCTIDIPELELRIIVKNLTQRKGQGVYDADKLVVADDLHIEIMALIVNKKLHDQTSTNQIQWHLNNERKIRNLPTVKHAPLVRKMSELLRKKVLAFTPPKWYKLDVTAASRIISDPEHKF